MQKIEKSKKKIDSGGEQMDAFEYFDGGADGDGNLNDDDYDNDDYGNDDNYEDVYSSLEGKKISQHAVFDAAVNIMSMDFAGSY